MKNKYCFTAVLLLVISLCAGIFTGSYVKHHEKDSGEYLTVVTSFYPMYIATVNIVGDCKGIQVKSLSEPQTGCLHDFQMTPKDMKLLSTADAFIVNGGGMENFLTEVAEQYPNLAIVESLSEIRDVDKEAHSHAFEEEQKEEHEHSHENSHLWMSVKHYREQVAVITEALCEIMEQQEGFLSNDEIIARIKANARKYDAKLAELEREQQEVIEASQGRNVISFHEAYEFIAEDYGMQIVYTLNLDEERQVSAGEVADVLKAMKQHHTELVLAEEIYGKKLADTLQKETDVTVVYLDTLVRGDDQPDSYIKGMQQNINRLKDAFGVN